MKKTSYFSLLLLALTLGVFSNAYCGPLPGAIFTTTFDGTVVNENTGYTAKEDVYLDGGPGPRAPSTAASLPQGCYYFQVTDPSGQTLLSTDHISCRKVHINQYGVIDQVFQGLNWVKQNGQWVQVPFTHKSGIDNDHKELGAITVQLFPYNNTPNPGGVYKVWLTPVEAYSGNLDAQTNGAGYQPGNYHGFIPAMSKTDNYKVRQPGKTTTAPLLTIRKFHDANMNGVKDADEVFVQGWSVDVVDPLGVTNTEYTDAVVCAPVVGTYIIRENPVAGTVQSVSYLDGQIYSKYPNATPIVMLNVAGTSGETHEVIFGNAATSSICACKVFDRNGNGTMDPEDPKIAGWKIQLSGTDLFNNPVGPIVQTTGANGCTQFCNLLPGSYTVTELMPSTGGWIATSNLAYPVTLTSTVVNGQITGTQANITFTNTQTVTVDFGTKGYWHNKNGLAELTQADMDFVNALAPYATPSSYFTAGNEPFNGLFTNGTPVAAAKGESGEQIAPAGSYQAEVSEFLVESNGGGDPREQLAQQLLAFIFNVRHRLGGFGATIQMPDTTFASTQQILDDAIAAWQFGSDSSRTTIKTLLDNFNNNNAVVGHPAFPGPVVY